MSVTKISLSILIYSSSIPWQFQVIFSTYENRVRMFIISLIVKHMNNIFRFTGFIQRNDRENNSLPPWWALNDKKKANINGIFWGTVIVFIHAMTFPN